MDHPSPPARSVRRRRLRPPLAALLLPLLSLLSLLGSIGPAGAQEPTTTTAPGAGPPPVPPTDPATDEPPGETVPDDGGTVPPPKGGYGDQGELQPQEVLWSSVRAAEQKLADAQAGLADTVERLRSSRHQRKQLALALDELDADTEQVVDELADAEERLVDRAVDGFVADDAVSNELVGSLDAARYGSVMNLRVRQTLLGAALDADDDAIADYLALRARLEAETTATLDGIHWLDRIITATEQEARDDEAEVQQASDELEAFRAGSSIYISGVVFPVAEPYGRPLIDSWGFPRMPGTPDEHWHEGIDIFAPAGTPLVAAERGVITRVGSGRLGGLTVWLRGESGAEWYYAHLQSHAPGLVAGQVVEAGDLLGYVGNTGNAAATPPHLHLQLHPGGGDPVNPYPLLQVISERDRVAGR